LSPLETAVAVALALIATACSAPAGMAAGPGSPATREAPPPADPSIDAVVNKEYLDAVLGMMDRATSTIRVVHFECNEDKIIDRIVGRMVDAAARGVDVMAVFEADLDGNARRVEYLVGKGVRARVDGERYTHAKLVVVDGREVLFGSTNFSYKSILSNNETNLHIVSAAAGRFYQVYAEALFADPVATPALEPVAVPEIGLLATLHDGDYFQRALDAIGAAKSRIHLLVYGMNLNVRQKDGQVLRLVNALKEALDRGVEVLVILEASDYNEDLNRLNTFAARYMTNACIKVRFEPLDQISHAKLLVVDDVAFVGSNNWGVGGFGGYHEVGGITSNAAVVSKLSDYFDTVWAESTPAAPPCSQQKTID